MDKAIIDKILHDLASPLTTLSFLADQNADIQAVVEDMTWRFKCLRAIFIRDQVVFDEISDLIQNLKCNTRDDRYGRLFLILAYISKNKPLTIEIDNHTLKIPSTFPKVELEDITYENVLVKCLREELNKLDLKIIIN